MVFSDRALVLVTLKMLSRRRVRALDAAVVGQAEIPALLALEKAKRGLGRQGSSLTNRAPSEHCREGALSTWRSAVFLEVFTEPFFLT